MFGHSATEIYAIAREWQTLISALIACFAAVVAWVNMSRQLRLNAISREEERLEKAVPALREAINLLSPFTGDLASDIVLPIFAERALETFPKEGSVMEQIRRMTPSADERLRREIGDAVERLVRDANELLQHMHENDLIHARLQSRLSEEDRAKWERTANTASDFLAGRQKSFKATLESVQGLALEFTQRRARLDSRLAKMRRAIERIIGV